MIARAFHHLIQTALPTTQLCRNPIHKCNQSQLLMRNIPCKFFNIITAVLLLLGYTEHVFISSQWNTKMNLSCGHFISPHCVTTYDSCHSPQLLHSEVSTTLWCEGRGRASLDLLQPQSPNDIQTASYIPILIQLFSLELLISTIRAGAMFDN